MKLLKKAIASLAVAAAVTAADNETFGASESRGIVLPIRSDTTKDAPVIDRVELYGASHALVVGIDRYQNGWPSLNNAVKDAELVAASLRAKGFSVTLRTNLNARDLETAFKEFFVLRGRDPKARLFVWYAGHGHTANGEGFLVPADAPRPDVDTTQFRLKALSLRRFGDFVRLAESKHAFAVFDSCFAGTVFDTARALPPVAVTRATTLPVRQFLTSGDAGQTVSDDGMFREMFLRALDGGERADANQDGFVTATEMGLFMSTRITNLTQSRQTPRYGKLRDSDWDRGDFVFRLADAGTNDSDPETVLWKLVDKNAQPAGYRAYLRQFPGGRYAAIARRKLQHLEARATETDAARIKALEAERARLERKRARLAAEVARAKQELAEQKERLAAVPKLPAGAISKRVSGTVWVPPDTVAYRPLPVGTEVNYGTWAFRVERVDGMNMVVRTRGYDLKTYHGVLAVLGEGIFSADRPLNAESTELQAPRVRLTAAAAAKIKAFWPLQIGKSVQFQLREFQAASGWREAIEDVWQIESVARRGERIELAGRTINAVVIESNAESRLGRRFRQSIWYAPANGLIVRLDRRWMGAKVAHAREGTHPGEVQRYQLEHFVFPPGHQRSAN